MARKFGPYVENIVGKRIIIVDDSIVRGTTMQPMVALLRSSGAKEVHIRIASPPIRHPCYMGINIPTKEELIANRVELDKLAQHFGMLSTVSCRALLQLVFFRTIVPCQNYICNELYVFILIVCYIILQHT